MSLPPLPHSLPALPISPPPIQPRYHIPRPLQTLTCVPNSSGETQHEQGWSEEEPQHLGQPLDEGLLAGGGATLLRDAGSGGLLQREDHQDAEHDPGAAGDEVRPPPALRRDIAYSYTGVQVFGNVNKNVFRSSSKGG